MESKLKTLKLKKALLLSDIEFLSEVDESLFIQLGKVVAEIWKLEKQIVRKVENDI